MRRTLTALALTLPAAALAQETVGAMNGTLDGERMAYTILSGDDYETGWRETDAGIEVTLAAFPSNTPASGDDERLRVVLVADTTTTTPEIQSGEVSLNRGGTEMTATDEAITMMFDSLEASGDGLLLIGNVRATLGEGDENVEVASEEGVTISYEIQANLFRNESE